MLTPVNPHVREGMSLVVCVGYDQRNSYNGNRELQSSCGLSKGVSKTAPLVVNNLGGQFFPCLFRCQPGRELRRRNHPGYRVQMAFRQFARRNPYLDLGGQLVVPLLALGYPGFINDLDLRNSLLRPTLFIPQGVTIRYPHPKCFLSLVYSFCFQML